MSVWGAVDHILVKPVALTERRGYTSGVRRFLPLLLALGCPVTTPTVESGCPAGRKECRGENPPPCSESDPDWALWYRDVDEDGFGDDSTAEGACSPPDGFVATGGDCADANAAEHPGATDVCEDGVDSDCDGRDPRCDVQGEVLLSEADAKVLGEASFMMGEYLDVGDLDGDGLPDVAANTMYADSMQGGAAIILGPVSGTHPLADVGVRVTSTRNTTSAGRSIAVGDVNGDGIADLAIGAPDATCMEWIVFGPLTTDAPLTDADVVRTGTADTEVGHGSDLADVTGDGVVDLLVGAYENDKSGRDAGAVFLEVGPVATGEADIDTAASRRFYGERAGSYAGRYVRAGEDVNGDGIGDMLFAAPYASDGAPQSGSAYLVYGGGTGDADLADADAKYGGEASGDYAGEALALGDVNDDGLADVLLGSYGNSGGSYAGAAHVVYGPANLTESLAGADVILRGAASNDQFGLAIAAKDTDGDGAADLLIGARGEGDGRRAAGGAALFYGPLTAAVDTSTPDVHFVGSGKGSGIGAAVDIADLDGDGAGDILLGAPTDKDGGASAGALFVVYSAPR